MKRKRKNKEDDYYLVPNNEDWKINEEGFTIDFFHLKLFSFKNWKFAPLIALSKHIYKA